MREPYIPLFCSITKSTLGSADPAVCKVYITMLAMADPEGFVASSLDGIAAEARLPLETVENALRELMSPDPRSRSRDHDGRRIFRVERGWHIPAMMTFRELARKESERARKREWARANNSGRPAGASATARRTETETEIQTEDPDPDLDAEGSGVHRVPPKSSRRGKLWHFVPEGWEPKPKHRERTRHWPAGVFAQELEAFRNHEFKVGKSDADRTFTAWLVRAEVNRKLPKQPKRAAQVGVDW